MRKFWIILSSGAVLCSSLLFCGCKQNKQQNNEISLSGAFALYPMAVKWAEEFKKLHPEVRIDISGGGAGKGMTDALSEVVDLGMVSREIHDVEVEKGAFGIAVVKDAVIPTININNPEIANIKKTGLTQEGAKALWSAQYNTWGDVLKTGNNTPVRVFTRSDACGAAETWAAYFGMRQEDLQGTAVFGDPGVASAVQKDKYGIGYNNIAYAYDQKTRKPYDGLAIMPIDANGNGTIDPEEDFYETTSDLMAAIADGRYPSPPARDLYLVSKGKPTKPIVIEFLKYILSEGQKYAAETGYIGLSETSLQNQLSKISE